MVSGQVNRAVRAGSKPATRLATRLPAGCVMTKCKLGAVKELKGGFYRYTSPQLNGYVWFSKAAFDGPAPATLVIDLPNVAALKPTGRPVDPSKLQAAADKAAADAAKKQARADALRAQLESLQGKGKLVKRTRTHKAEAVAVEAVAGEQAAGEQA